MHKPKNSQQDQFVSIRIKEEKGARPINTTLMSENIVTCSDLLQSLFNLQPTTELNPQIQALAALYQVSTANQQPEQSKLTVCKLHHFMINTSFIPLHTVHTCLCLSSLSAVSEFALNVRIHKSFA